MSEIPAAEVVKNANAPVEIKRRTAAAVIRFMQKAAPTFDELRLLNQEVADVVAVHGTVTDEDLAELGVSAATLGNMVTFMTKFIEFFDKETQTQIAYRKSINTVRRVGANL